MTHPTAPPAARRCVLRSVYGDTPGVDALAEDTVSAHVLHASRVPFVVPRALLLALPGAAATAGDADQQLRDEPVLRKLLELHSAPPTPFP